MMNDLVCAVLFLNVWDARSVYLPVWVFYVMRFMYILFLYTCVYMGCMVRVSAVLCCAVCVTVVI